MELKRVVVTGLGALTPIGNTVPEYWNGLLDGVSGGAKIAGFDASNFKSQIACEVKNFDVNAILDRKEARKYDKFCQYALAVAKEAVEDAAFELDKVNLDRVGVIWGTGIGGIKTFESEMLDFAKGDGVPHFNPFFIPKIIVDLAPGHISMKYGFRGVNYSTVSACASSTHAIADAFNYIRLGKADVIVTGGSEAAVTPGGVGGFTAMHALSTRNDSPETASRPFSKSRDGFVIGEGAACLVLEEYEHAKARGAKIYAEMVGAGMTADAHHMTAPHPEGVGALNVMKLAVEDGGLSVEDIDYINVHGTSTPLGDIAECKAIKQLFGEHAYKLNISSTKSMTGHLLGATGAAEAVACVLAVKNDIVPPTINFTEGDEDPEIDYKLNFTFGKAQKRVVRAALSNTFGFGGHNASVVFKKITQ
ncbi:MAG: beta-ketoacyl-ACP synthase II [Paludibacteraceae bacterium]|nr:beta-ketoacyl-ACP synthase II [Paludibacteraceae bacterium]MBO7259237.1 beta-ketoacyl-ACP synthase II [Paludibacteraceae bacterium]